jgi:hypothetical protein
MRPIVNASRALSTLAIAAAALVAEFGVPAPAHAFSIIIGDSAGPAIEGSGKLVDVHRDVGAFHALRIDGPLDVDARPGTSPGVTVHADDNVEPLVETVVEDDTLIVRLRHGTRLNTHGKMRVDVQFTRLDATKQMGSGDLVVQEAKATSFKSAIAGGGNLALHHVQAGQLAVSVAGSGDVTADGQADEAKFSVAGSGDITADSLVARKVEVHISGSGDARVQATESLDARIAGSGDIAYRGHPRDVSRKVSGSGSIHAQD